MYKVCVEKNFLSFVPKNLSLEVKRLCISRGRDVRDISELRIRCYGRSSAIICGERVQLLSPVSESDVKKCFLLICEGALYAHRDNVRAGYITLEGGVRVGICGQARYEGGEFVGVSNVTSLVFRIPTQASSNTDVIYDAWCKSKKGMLIYSSPGVGKTTALRSLVSVIGKGKDASQVVVVDERCEFMPDEYACCAVDILRGYRRAEGIEIALRVLSAEVICVDEIGNAKEAAAMLESLNSGVRFIATVHASSYKELSAKVNIKTLLDFGVFDVFVGLSLDNGVRKAEIMRI